MNLEKVGLFVLIAILVGGLATSPVFSSSYSAFAQEDEVCFSDKATVSVSSGEDEAEESEQDEMDKAERDEMEDKDDDDYYHDKIDLKNIVKCQMKKKENFSQNIVTML